MSEIIIKDATKIFGDITVIKDLNLRVKNGQLFTLLGPSGCGKTTLLRMIAGFNTIEGGDFYFNDTRINNMDPSKRNIGMVFQNYAIFPHLTVRENVAFGLKQRKIDKETIKKKTDHFLKLMQIYDYADRKPDKLSGGQQQRVALARALVIEPDVLLMDEPLSNLDAKLRVEMREAIRQIQHEVGITTVYVTHDQEEAMAISDEIAVMKDGIIQHLGKPREIYHKPANVFVATFIGRTNLLDGELIHENGQAKINLNCGYSFFYPLLNQTEDQKVRVSIRPEDFMLNIETGLRATVNDSIYLGLNTEYYCLLDDGTEIQMVEESNLSTQLENGQVVPLGVKIEKINIFTEDGSANLGIV
ncbi:MAG TPA: ABC transporter ATP-binding protein [Clostridiaceae bacterium]|nr:ABC transporter ATP-binding protein [Clostridiaceae bacterium]